MSRRTSPIWKSPYLLLFAVLLLTTLCKLLRLGSRELWLDETYSAYVTSLSFLNCYRFIAGDLHPRLFHLVLWFWVHLFGEAETHLRLFSVTLSIFAALGMFLFARRVLSLPAAVVATSLFALSPTLFVYSLEVRNYMLLVLILVFLLNLHWIVAVQGQTRPRYLVLYAALGAVLFYNHYLGILVLVALLAHWIVISRLSWSRLRIAGIVAVLVLLFSAPGVPLLLQQLANKKVLNLDLTQSHTNPQALSVGDNPPSSTNLKTAVVNTAENIAAIAGIFPARSRLLFALCAVPLLAAFGFTIYLWLARGDIVCGFMAIFGVVFSLAVIGAGFNNHRYFIPLIPLLVLALARAFEWGWEAQSRRNAALSLAAAVFAVYIAGFLRQAAMPHGRPWSNVIAAIQHNAQPGDLVVFDAVYGQIPFDYTAGQQHVRFQETGFPISVYQWWEEQRFKAWGSPVLYRSDLDDFTRRFAASPAHAVWLVQYESFYYDPFGRVLAGLSRAGHAREIPLPPDPDDRGVQPPSVRLFEISK